MLDVRTNAENIYLQGIDYTIDTPSQELSKINNKLTIPVELPYIWHAIGGLPYGCHPVKPIIGLWKASLNRIFVNRSPNRSNVPNPEWFNIFSFNLSLDQWCLEQYCIVLGVSIGGFHFGELQRCHSILMQLNVYFRRLLFFSVPSHYMI